MRAQTLFYPIRSVCVIFVAFFWYRLIGGFFFFIIWCRQKHALNENLGQIGINFFFQNSFPSWKPKTTSNEDNFDFSDFFFQTFHQIQQIFIYVLQSREKRLGSGGFRDQGRVTQNMNLFFRLIENIRMQSVVVDATDTKFCWFFFLENRPPSLNFSVVKSFCNTYFKLSVSINHLV